MNGRYVSNGRLYNNSTNDNYIMSQEEFINRYLNEPWILSGYACFYKNQNDSVNITSKALENLGDMRKFNKKKMEAAEHGSDDYIYYKVLQLTYKVLMNSYYGILGEKNSVFYNPYVQNSITMSGQDLITTGIIAMEMFLSNNIKFNDTDDAITFINNIKNSQYKYSILDYVNEPITKSELLEYLMTRNKYEEIQLNKNILESIISKLSSEIITRIYYTNQVSKLIENEWFKDKLRNIVQYVYAEEPDPEQVQYLKPFVDVLVDCCWYDFLIEDRYKRAMKDKRQTVVTIDTDSIFCNVNKYVKQISNMFGLDNSNKTQQTTIVNVFINIVTICLGKLYWNMTGNLNLVDEAKPIINMKSESRNRLLYTVMCIANLFNCWDRKKSAAKPLNRGTFNEYRKGNSDEISEIGTE